MAREAVIVDNVRTGLTKAHQGKRFGIVTMCVGGGQGFATLFEAG